MFNKAKFIKFISYYRPYKLLFAADIICAVLTAVLGLLIPYFIRVITTELLVKSIGESINQIILVAGLLLGTILLRMFTMFFYDAKGHTMGAMMERNMRQELFDHLQELSFSFYDENKTGKLMSKLTNDLNSLSEFYHHAPEDLVIYLVQFFGAMFILLSINVKLTAVILLFFPFIIVFAVIFSKRLKKSYKSNYEALSEVNSRAEESISGIRTTQSYCNEETEKERFSVQNNIFFKSRRAIYHDESYYYTGMDTVVQLITAAVVVAGAILISNNTLELPDLIVFIMYVGYMVSPIEKISHITQQYQEGFSGFERFFELLSTKADINDCADAVPVNGFGVEFKDVSFRYKNSQENILKNVSFKVNPGDYVALVGMSGTGKTTICSLIPRFYDVDSGEIYVGDKNVKSLTLNSLREAVGIVQQDTYLFSGTVMENILYGSIGSTEEQAIQAAKKANAHDFIVSLPNGYDTDIGHRGIKLSGGQKQRLSIARVFLKNPPILIFDEATSSLDNESEGIIQKSLEELTVGRTTIVIAHRLSTIKNAKEILFLSDGEIVEQGSHNQLLKQDGLYKNLYSKEG